MQRTDCFFSSDKAHTEIQLELCSVTLQARQGKNTNEIVRRSVTLAAHSQTGTMTVTMTMAMMLGKLRLNKFLSHLPDLKRFFFPFFFSTRITKLAAFPIASVRLLYYAIVVDAHTPAASSPNRMLDKKWQFMMTK